MIVYVWGQNRKRGLVAPFFIGDFPNIPVLRGKTDRSKQTRYSILAP